MKLLPQRLPDSPDCLRMQHEAEPLPAGSAWKLQVLYGAAWEERLGPEPEPSVLLLHDLARALPDVRLLMGAESQVLPRLEALASGWDVGNCLRFVPVDAPTSPWVRDLGVLASDSQGPVTLLPAAFRTDDPDPLQAGAAAAHLALANASGLRTHRIPVLFEGGDVLCDGECAFAGELTLSRNAMLLGLSRTETVRRLEEGFGLPVEVLPSYAYHLDLFVSFPAPGLACLANPAAGLSLARQALEAGGMRPEAAEELFAMATSTECRLREGGLGCVRLKTVHDRLVRLGYTIVHLPFLHGVGDDSADPALVRTALASYHNALFWDRPGQQPLAVLGSSGHPALDSAGAEAYEALGFEVRWIAAAAISTMQLGGVRCATAEFC